MMRIGLALMTLVLTASCGSNDARIDGRFAGCGNQKVYLERVLPSRVAVVDSAVLSNKGEFTFRVEFDADVTQPVIYNVKYRNDVVPLLLNAGERVKLGSMGRVSRNYTVEGSPGSENLREFRMLMQNGAERLDSIQRVYSAAKGSDKKSAGTEYMSEYYRIKQQHLAFIMKNPGSVEAIYALYQRLPKDTYLFSEQNDLIYYRMVADSAAKYIPDSPYTNALMNDVSKAEETNKLSLKITQGLQNAEEVGFIDIVMKDIYDKEYRLSSLAGNVILLDFWAVLSGRAKMNNAEYRHLYAEYRGKGFEIYQVAIDNVKPRWVAAVQRQNLPWISVCDLKGESSPVIGLYNVAGLPANFLIDKHGDIVAKNIYGDELAKKVRELVGR